MNARPDASSNGHSGPVDDPDRVDPADLENVDLDGFDEDEPLVVPSGEPDGPPDHGPDAPESLPEDVVEVPGHVPDEDLDGDFDTDFDTDFDAGLEDDRSVTVPTLSPEDLAGLGIGQHGPDEAPARPERVAPSDPPTANSGIPVVEPGGRSARLRRKIAMLGRRWQRSLSLRVVLTTTASLAAVFSLLLVVVTVQIRDGLYDDRVEEILTDAAYRTARAQETFDASTASTSQELQRLAMGAIDQQVLATTSGPVGATIMSSPGQTTTVFSEPTTSIALRELVTQEMRQAVEGSEQYWQSVAIPSASGSADPGVVVGQSVTLPGAGRYQYYLFYSLAAEESATRVVMQVLAIAGSIFIVVVGIIVALVVRSVLRPVRQAALSAERLADGMLDERMEVRSRDEIARLARSFNEMAASLQHQIERLASLSALQQRFVSDVSHELRTPLTTVKMAADMIYDGRDEFPPQLRRSAELLQTQIDRFDTMLADLLEISRIDAGAAVLDLEDHDLRDIVSRVADLALMLAENRKTEILVEPYGAPVVAECDGRRIERIVRNLVVNAVEHSEGRPVVVTLATNAEAVAVRVRDHGVGMTREEAGRVFDRFWRADPARARTTGGTGLGLTISLEDARLHGGTLTATGRPGEGASFLLVLPRTAGATFDVAPLALGELAEDPPEPERPGGVGGGLDITQVETMRGQDDADSASAERGDSSTSGTPATPATPGALARPAGTGEAIPAPASAPAPARGGVDDAATERPVP